MTHFLLSIFCFVIAIAYGAIQRLDPLVLIEQGLVRGQKSSDGSYSSFLGIPYAKVDLQNPFGPSLPPASFEEEIFNAFDGTTKCPQTKFDLTPIRSSDEETVDCLSLNIFVPSEASSTNPLPVFVWIHGGGSYAGSAGEDGEPYIVRHGVVVVMINYRLGPYGFFCLDTKLAPGNQGLKDQLEALRWIRKNIASFGGNPYNVTLGGLSAGSTAAILHLYSNKEKLFNKIIAQSGSPLGEGRVVRGDRDAALKLANYLGFSSNDTDQALHFLSETPHSLVTGAFKNLGIRLRPCLETSFDGIESFLETDPRLLYNDQKVANTPILIGRTNKDLIGSVEQIYDDDQMDLIFYNKIRNNFNLDYEETNALANLIRDFYIGDSPMTAEIYSKLDEFESDFVFTYPIQRTIDKLRQDNAYPIYEYLFTYVGDSGDIGAGHGSDLRFLFKISEGKMSEEDQFISDSMTACWANFIKNGNPTPADNSPISITWEPISENERPYLEINTNLQVKHNFFRERMAFWNLVYHIYEERSVIVPY